MGARFVVSVVVLVLPAFDGDGACDYCEDADRNNECDCDGEIGYDGSCACDDADGDGECDPPGVEITASALEYYIETNETMPAIEFHARLKNAHSAMKAAGVKYKDVWFRWHLNMSYDDRNLTFAHRVPSGLGTYDEQYGTGTWRPEWGALVAGAQTLSAHVMVGTGTEQPTAEDTETGLRIKGRNPSTSQIAGLASSPWYATRLIRAESSCRQFDDGYPLKSEDNGYGLMQITNPAPSEEDLWRWTTNVATGLSLLRTDKIVWADSFWARQEREWKEYNAGPEPDVPAPEDRSYHGGAVNFGYSSGHALRHGLAIKYYNGNGCRRRADGTLVTPGCVTGAWLAWQNKPGVVTPYWAYNEGDNYVEHLTGQMPCE